MPGWAIAVFALALLVPAAVAALDGVARAARRRAGVVRAIVWAFALALPLAGLVIAVLVAGVAGLVADPAYPFDPGRFDLGVPEALLIIALLAAAVWRLRPDRPRPPAHPITLGGPGPGTRRGRRHGSAGTLARKPLSGTAAGAGRSRLAPGRPPPPASSRRPLPAPERAAGRARGPLLRLGSRRRALGPPADGRGRPVPRVPAARPVPGGRHARGHAGPPRTPTWGADG